MRHQQRRHPVPLGQHRHFLAQPARHRLIERDKRLIEQKKIRAHSECPGDGDAAGEAEREFAGIMRQMRSKSERFDQVGQIVQRFMGGKHQPDIFRDSSPRQQPRLLENDFEASARDPPLAGEIRIEPRGDVQDRGLAAAGRADHGAKATRFKPQVQPADNLDGRALGRNKGLGVDAKFKRAGAAIGLFVVQAVAPAGFRSRA